MTTSYCTIPGFFDHPDGGTDSIDCGSPAPVVGLILHGVAHVACAACRERIAAGDEDGEVAWFDLTPPRPRLVAFDPVGFENRDGQHAAAGYDPDRREFICCGEAPVHADRVFVRDLNALLAASTAAAS